MRLLPEETQCLVIDMQEKLVPAMSDLENLNNRVEILLKGLRLLGIPMMLTQQYTKGLGNSLPYVYEAAGTTKYYEKNTFSCVRDEETLKALRDNGRKNILVCGTETHICVLQSCMELKALGFQPIMVADAVGSRKPFDKEIGLQRAVQEGILLTTTEAALFEMTVDSKNPHFREISALVK
ncbi:MAG: hydrolase [Lachnospiraceae bacterium]|nr:hydrolase [Lachnospiraceae bacterium]